jgi:hypothetical protein
MIRRSDPGNNHSITDALHDIRPDTVEGVARGLVERLLLLLHLVEFTLEEGEGQYGVERKRWDGGHTLFVSKSMLWSL